MFMSYQIKKWLSIFGICNFVALFSFSAYQASFLMEQESVPAIVILVNEFTGSYSFFSFAAVDFVFYRTDAV